MKKQYDRRHHARELPLLEEDTPVFIVNGQDSNAVSGRELLDAPAIGHTYLVEMSTGTSRRKGVN